MQETTWYEGSFVLGEGTIDGELQINIAVEDGDVFVGSRTKIEVISEEPITFTRAEAINKVHYYLGVTSVYFGADSKEAEALEADIEALENGAALSDFAFLFGLEVPKE